MRPLVLAVAFISAAASEVAGKQPHPEDVGGDEASRGNRVLIMMPHPDSDMTPPTFPADGPITVPPPPPDISLEAPPGLSLPQILGKFEAVGPGLCLDSKNRKYDVGVVEESDIVKCAKKCPKVGKGARIVGVEDKGASCWCLYDDDEDLDGYPIFARTKVGRKGYGPVERNGGDHYDREISYCYRYQRSKFPKEAPGFVPVGDGFCRSSEGESYDWIYFNYGNYDSIKKFKQCVKQCPRSGLVGVTDVREFEQGMMQEFRGCECLYEDGALDGFTGSTGYVNTEGRGVGRVSYNDEAVRDNYYEGYCYEVPPIILD